MSIEIKFRAWDKVTWEIKEVEDIYFYEKANESGMLWELTYRWDKCSKYFWENIDDFDMEQCKIMQYTWLKDKNWVKIYEWDIVQRYGVCFVWTIEERKKTTSKIIYTWVVKWNEDEVYYDYDNWNIWIYNWYECLKVIWNIYENKELLETN